MLLKFFLKLIFVSCSLISAKNSKVILKKKNKNNYDFKMSYVFETRNQENQGGRRGKAMATRSNVHGAPKRAALGVITNQVNQQQNVRVQPSRAAKPKVSTPAQ